MRIALIVVAVVAAAVAGSVAGNLRAGTHAAADLARIQQEKEALQREAEQTARRLDDQHAELERAQAEKEALERRLARLDSDLAAQRTAAEAVSEFSPELAAESDVSQAATSGRDNEERRGRGRDEWRQRVDEMQNSEGWAARREEFTNRIRDRVDNFVSGQLEQNPDPESQQRILAIEEYTNYTMDLFQQMQATDDEAERDRLREELGAARETMRSLVTQQQNHMLRNAAAEAGIRDPKRQDEFVAELRQTLESPFFRSPEAFTRGGRGFGGWGGFGRGGGLGVGGQAPSDQ